MSPKKTTPKKTTPPPKPSATPVPAAAAGQAPPPPPISTSTFNILDSVCVLYFTASGQIKLLVDILTAADYSILLPTEVLEECKNKAEQAGWNITGLHRALGGRIKLLPAIDETRPNAFAKLSEIRAGHPAGSTGSADLGECVCITHAIGAKSQGIPVKVFIDDLNGQLLADAKQVDIFTIEDALATGVDYKVITRTQARDAYKRLVPYGSALPTWPASALKQRLHL